MTTPALYLALPCQKCGVSAGTPCVKADGEPRTRQHSGRTPLSPCGTFGGYQRHKKAGEVSCEPCRDANRRYQSAYRTRRPEVREADMAALAARHKATKALIQLHRDDFNRLLADFKVGAA